MVGDLLCGSTRPIPATHDICIGADILCQRPDAVARLGYGSIVSCVPLADDEAKR
jgi:hypothetical protein